MPISTRLMVQSTVVLLAIGLVALLVVVGMTIWLNNRAQIYFDDVIEARDARGAAVELRAALQAAEASQRGFLLTGNEIYLAPYGTARALAQDQVEIVKRLLSRYPGREALAERLSAVVREKLAELDNTIALKSDQQDAEAMAFVRTNRGKALMDEANVFLSGVIRAADERLTDGVGEQRRNARYLRWASIVAALVIIGVVAGVVAMAAQYTREIRQARNEVQRVNTGLETRVAQRTEELERARERAELLLAEMNHRVANGLQMVGALVKLQADAMTDEAAKKALAETQARIYAVGLIHTRLYSSGDVRTVALDEYLSTLLDHLATSMRGAGHGASVTYSLAPLRLLTDTSVSLGVVVTEWVTNAFKYAYPDWRGEIRVRLAGRADGDAELEVEDDGIGRTADSPAKGTGLGSRLVDVVARTMGGRVEYLPRQPGTLARLVFPLRRARPGDAKECSA